MEFFGLEVDRNVLIESSTYSSRQDLQDVTQETLFLFADVSSSLSPQTFAIDWIIMARHAVMTISNANAEQLMEEENEGVEESQSALATREKLNSSTIYNFQVFKENLDRSANDSTLLNKFVTFVKEKNRMNASCFEGTSRTQLKWVAVKCARIALQNVVVRLGDIDIFAGKGLTVEAIKSALARDSSEEFYNTPKFLSVFLSEIINLACAGTTFTMNDKPVRALQYESLLIIEKIVNELINSRDPDVAESDKIAESKILHPYLSQLLSSVKLCVAAPWYANMRLPAAAVVANLIKGSFIADKIILRRTLKSFTTHWGASGESERLDISCRPKETLHASEESNLADHVALSISVAMVYISTYSSSEISESFQANITGMLNDIGNLEKLWFGIMQDLLRVKLIMSAVHANGDLSPLTTALTTKALSPAIHPQRGGQVFLPGMLSKDVVPQYFHNLPKLMYAYLLLKAKTVKAEEVKTLWSMNTLLIYIEVDLFKKNWKEKNIGDLKCLLLILIQLGKEPSFSIIGIDPWIDVLTTLESIIVDKVKNKSPGWNNLLVSLLQLEMTLIGRLEIIDVKKDKRMEEKVKKYWFVLWITLLASLHAYYPIIFNSIEFNHSTMYEKSVAKIALCTPNAILQAAINSELVEKSRIIFLQSFGKVLLKMVTYNRQVGLYALDLLLALASAEICFSTDSTPSIPLSESIFNLLLETISNVYRVLDDDGRLSFNKSNDKMMLAMIKDTDNAKKVSVYDKISQMALHIIGLAGTSGTKV